MITSSILPYYLGEFPSLCSTFLKCLGSNAKLLFPSGIRYLGFERINVFTYAAHKLLSDYLNQERTTATVFGFSAIFS